MLYANIHESNNHSLHFFYLASSYKTPSWKHLIPKMHTFQGTMYVLSLDWRIEMSQAVLHNVASGNEVSLVCKTDSSLSNTCFNSHWGSKLTDLP